MHPHTTKRKTTTNLQTKNNQNCQKIELYGCLRTKELKKKHSARLVRVAEMGSLGGEDAGQGCGWSTRQALAVPHLHADKLGGTMWSKTDHITQVPAQKKKASKPLAIKTCEGCHSRRNSQAHRRVP